MANGGFAEQRNREPPEAAEALLAAQRQLRRDILDDASGAQWKPARDLAAHMLLYLDSPTLCAGTASYWIRDAFCCDRADIGLGHPSNRLYEPGFAESRSIDNGVDSIAGLSVDNRDKGVRALWFSDRPLIYGDLSQDARFGSELRHWFVRNGARSKLAWSLSNRGLPLGLICIDWVKQAIPSDSDIVGRFQDLCRDVLNPIMGASLALSVARHASACAHPEAGNADPETGIAGLLDRLSDAELRVAQLAASGLAYKEIAHVLNRSFSTIDHQLRSVRTKLKVRNQAELVALLVRYSPRVGPGQWTRN